MARIEKSIEVKAPLHAVYDQWTRFEEFPRFMEGVSRVTQLDATHLRWQASVAGKEKQWDAEITEQVPGRRISWRSVGGTRNAGTVEFRALAEDRTLIWLIMEYDPEGLVENVGDALGLMSRRAAGDLERFRDFIEARGRETGQWRDEAHRGAGRREQAWRDERAGGWSFGREALQEPYERLRRLAREMDTLFERLLGAGARGEGRAGPARDQWTPKADVFQAGDELVIRADLPGTRREDVDVEVQESRVVIQGERRLGREPAEGGAQATECPYGRFYREIPLPYGAETDTARASLRDGVLEVRIRVPGRRQGRRLVIEDGVSAEEVAPVASDRASAEAGAAPADGGKGDWHLGR